MLVSSNWLPSQNYIIMRFNFLKRKTSFNEFGKKFNLSKAEKADVTIVLNIWKRHYFEEQLEALLKQSILPKEIWVIHYETHVDIQKALNKFRIVFPNIIIINSGKNLKYFGRLSIAINANTKFLWFLDDDIIPGNNYLKNCLKNCIANNSIICCSGRIIPKNNLRPEEFNPNTLKSIYIGDYPGEKKSFNYCATNSYVDYGCQSYFIKREWLSIIWSIWPITFLSGEDIHLSATCKLKLDIDTIVIQQTNLFNTGNLKIKYGRDKNASWRDSNFINIREKVFKYHIENNGWRPINW